MTQPGIYSESLAFAQREVISARRRAQLALRHRDAIGDLPIHELRELADQTAILRAREFKAALDKRGFELRQLTTSI